MYVLAVHVRGQRSWKYLWKIFYIAVKTDVSFHFEWMTALGWVQEWSDDAGLDAWSYGNPRMTDLVRDQACDVGSYIHRWVKWEKVP